MDKKLRAKYYERVILAESGNKEEYTEYFENKMDKYDADEITDLESTEEKKKFFNKVDNGWQAEDEQDANDLLPGGLAAGDSDDQFNPEQLAKGIKVELEHTDDINIAKEIAKDHLKEMDDYYDKLETIEPEHAAYDEQSQGPGHGHGGYVLDRATAAKRYAKSLLK